MKILNKNECLIDNVLYEKCDETDCMFFLHKRVMYRVWFDEQEYDYIDDPVLIKQIEEVLK